MILAAWHWLVMGVALVILEMFVPTFALLWFGVSAMVVALLLWLLPGLGLTGQVLIWLGLSSLLCLLWFKWLKPRMTHRSIADDVSREAIVGQIGLLIVAPLTDRAGMVRFAVPHLGSTEWPCRSLSALAVGDRVQVVDILGNELLVRSTGGA